MTTPVLTRTRISSGPLHLGEQHYRDLRRRYTLRLLLIYFTPLILLTVYFFFQHGAIVRESERLRLRARAEHQANTLDLFLSERRANLINLINDPHLPYPPDSRTLQTYLEELKRMSKTFVDLGCFDDSGVQTAYAGPHPSLKGLSYREEPWYVDLMEGKDDFIVTDIYPGFRKELHFTIAVKRTVRGETVVLRSTLDPGRVDEYIRSLEGSGQVFTSLVNKGGAYQVVTGQLGTRLQTSSFVPPADPRVGAASVWIEGSSVQYGYSWLRMADWAVIVQWADPSHHGVLAGIQLRVPGIAGGVFAFVFFVIVYRARKRVEMEQESDRTRSRLIADLEESEERNRLIVETALDAVITSDVEGVITGWNAQAKAIFGWTREEVVGQRLSDTIVPRQYREAHQNGLRHFADTGEGPILNKRIEFMALHRDGHEFPVEVKISPVHRRGATIFTAFVSDITQRKRAEEEAQKHQTELAHVWRVSTAGELMSGLAHELNQPLTAIAYDVAACANYVRSGKGEVAKLVELLERASTEAQRAGQIVHHLRDFVQKREPRFETFDLCELVRKVSDLLEAQIEQQSIGFELDVGSGALWVRADAIQVEQVLVNLIQNAVEAIEEARDGGRELRVEVGRSQDGMAEVAVHDTGMGLSPGTSERLLESFFTTKPHGLGMGLPISRSIIEAHHGSFSISPRLDGRTGTTARFALPLDPGKLSREGQ
jgi:two-component system sensor kinase FixL